MQQSLKIAWILNCNTWRNFILWGFLKNLFPCLLQGNTSLLVLLINCHASSFFLRAGIARRNSRTPGASVPALPQAVQMMLCVPEGPHNKPRAQRHVSLNIWDYSHFYGMLVSDSVVLGLSGRLGDCRGSSSAAHQGWSQMETGLRGFTHRGSSITFQEALTSISLLRCHSNLHFLFAKAPSCSN